MNKTLIAVGVGCAISSPLTLAVGNIDIEEDGNVRSIEVIQVQAQKRTQDIQDVGIAISAFSGDSLRSLGMFQSNEIAAQIPNVSISNNGGPDGLPLFFIRGVGLTDFSNANSGPIGIYANDVYLKAPRTQNFSLFDIESVEILKGPQGTLFGRNTTGGAMLFSSVKPTDDFSGNINLNAGNFGTYAVEGGVGGALSDNLLVRVAGRYSKTDGYLDNLFTGDTQGAPEKLTYRTTFIYEATDNFNLTAIVEGGSKDGHSVANKSRGIIDPATGGICSPEKSRTYQCADALGQVPESNVITQVNNNLVMDHTEEYLSGTLRMNWQLSDNISLVSISNHMELEAFQPDDTDSSPMKMLELFLYEESSQLTQEFQLLGEYDNSSWVLGAYYLTDSATANHDYEVFQEFAPMFNDIPITATPAEAEAALGPLYGLAGSTGVFNEKYDQEVDSISLFGQYERQLSEQWNVTVGLRYTDEKTTIKLDTVFDASLYPIDNTDGLGDYFFRGEIPTVAQDEEVSNSNVSGKIGLNYKLQENILFYSSVSSAFKAPGFNTSAVFSQNEAKSFDSEEMTAVELGVKSDLYDNQLRINASIFSYDYADMQVYTSRTTDSGVPARFIDNAAKGDYQGAELEVIAMLTQDLRLQLGLSYIDAELKDFFNETGVDPGTGEPIVEDFSGATTPFTPKTSANIMLNQYWEVAGGELDLQIDYNWQDDVFHGATNDPYTVTQAYGLLNSHFMWTNSDSSLSLSVWAKNITDEQYITFSPNLEAFGLIKDIAGVPRTVGASISYHFY